MNQNRSFFPSMHACGLAAVAVAGLLTFPVAARGQAAPQPAADPAMQMPTQTPAPAANTQTTTSATTDASGRPVQTVTTSTIFHRGKKKTDGDKKDKVLQSKDTKKAIRKDLKVETLAGVDSKLPDKQLYDKAVIAMNKGHFDVARLDLQTMLNTYPDSQYQMRAKLAIADSWYKEGGTAALTQAESEYADFRVFFPNAPEAAEAQMRIGDIYFRQMDKPDRDYAKSIHAEEEYRRMLTDYPNAPPQLMTQAKQRLREVQEVLASREADIASYYATRENWAAVIARYQTVVDTYPLYSHMDDTLVGLGDAYEAQARYVRGMKVTAAGEGGKAKLEQVYDGLAADCYRKVVLEHAAAPHVDDARDRLEAMGLEIPKATPEALAASAALENSRSTYGISDRAKLLFLHTPDTVLAPRMGEPTLTDAKATTAPSVVKRVNAEFARAFTPEAPTTAPVVANGPTTAAAEPAKAAAPAVAAAPLAFQPVGTEDAAPSSASTMSAGSAGSVPAGASIGASIVPAGTALPPENPPGGEPSSGAGSAGNMGLGRVGPVGNNALPAAEKPAAAPDQLNDIPAGTAVPVAQAVPAKGKAAKPSFDKSDESSSKHKKKKGLKKLDPLPQ